MQCKIVKEWDELLATFPIEKRDIYFTKKYLTLYESPKHKALCIACTDGGRIMLMPYLRGEIKSYHDFETAYGYGGPVSNCDDFEWCREAYNCMYDCFKENNYVCGFSRLHPLLGNDRFIIQDMDITSESRWIQLLYDRQTVAIETSCNIEDIWTKQISSKNRNMIRKAEKNGLVYKAEYDYASYDEFIELYRDTMKRLLADEFYWFSDQYFAKLKLSLSDCSFLGTVRKNGKLICAAIFMYSELYGHYHLEGSDREYSSLGANNLLIWKTACEMHDLGIREFHLGGGTTSAVDDSLFKFKKAFSSNEKQFYICKEIFNKQEYTSICKEWEKDNEKMIEVYGNRLLKYRY